MIQVNVNKWVVLVQQVTNRSVPIQFLPENKKSSVSSIRVLKWVDSHLKGFVENGKRGRSVMNDV
ncbi:hypothetical protein VL06_01020 [Rossellomorea marisflavi]|uniref:Uncharacterized protein n=1 Tax=Rossellomorea marisflavi TaxID=189381 RepID=A0A0J5SH76_9BACI|nr:hypothetical protein VL03_11020 [Rossellomorea marisflavi]KML08084.1 hypothetical protein VL06_01020 [Rossellomorea marisflavi]KML34244.1 hypothetical protein VL12_06450 [Rossellomorea marisflavi]KZE51418.1 hypothetical protein AV649_14430 [Rossellomorea marisflavi]